MTYTDARGLFELSRLVPGTATLGSTTSYAPGGKRVKIDKGGQRPAAAGRARARAAQSLVVVVRAVGGDADRPGAWRYRRPGVGRRRRPGRGARGRPAAHEARCACSVEAPGWVSVSTSFAQLAGVAPSTLVVDLEEAAGSMARSPTSAASRSRARALYVRTRDGNTVLAETPATREGRWSIEGLPEAT